MGSPFTIPQAFLRFQNFMMACISTTNKYQICVSSEKMIPDLFRYVNLFTYVSGSGVGRQLQFFFQIGHVLGVEYWFCDGYRRSDDALYGFIWHKEC